MIEVFRVAMGHERKLAEREALTLLNEVMRAWTQGELTRLAAK
nr:hypothetical protein [Kofleriaceae bacterium]